MKTLFLYIVREDAPSVSLAGSTPAEWLKRGVDTLPRREIARETDAEFQEGFDYIAVLYPTTPLVTASHLAELIKEMDKRGIAGLEIGRGKVLRAEAFLRGIAPKRRCAAPFALELGSPASYRKIERELFRRNAEKCEQNGAIIPDVDSVRIDARSLVEEGATVEPYCTVTRSVVRRGARLGCFSETENAEIGEGAELSRSVVKDSVIGAGAKVGPFAYIRQGSEIGAGCRIGDFVEVKASRLGAGTKAAHLTYIGDAAVGERTNVGCGTVFANYDGKVKHRTTVGEGVFLGANTNLVAPVSVGDGAYIAAATTVTEDVPKGAFVIGRVRAEEKEKRKG